MDLYEPINVPRRPAIPRFPSGRQHRYQRAAVVALIRAHALRRLPSGARRSRRVCPELFLQWSRPRLLAEAIGVVCVDERDHKDVAVQPLSGCLDPIS